MWNTDKLLSVCPTLSITQPSLFVRSVCISHALESVQRVSESADIQSVSDTGYEVLERVFLRWLGKLSLRLDTFFFS